MFKRVKKIKSEFSGTTRYFYRKVFNKLFNYKYNNFYDIHSKQPRLGHCQSSTIINIQNK